MLYNSGAIIRRLGEGSTLSKTNVTPSAVTNARIAAQQQIAAMASNAGMTLDQALTMLCKDPDTQAKFIYYVRSAKESPFLHPMKLAAQAALLRFQDIATVSKALNISDAQALLQIEASETEALQYNNPDAGILTPDIAAILCDIIDEMQSAAGRNGLPTTSVGLYSLITNILGDNFSGGANDLLNGISAVLANQADGDDPTDDGTSWLDSITGGGSTPNPGYSPAPDPLAGITGSVGSVNTNGIFNQPTYNPTLDASDDPTQNGTAPSDNGSGFNLSSIFSTINSAISTVKNATGAAGGASSTLNGILNKIGAGVGGSAINNSSLPLLIGGGIALIIIVIIAMHYAGNNK